MVISGIKLTKTEGNFKILMAKSGEFDSVGPSG